MSELYAISMLIENGDAVLQLGLEKALAKVGVHDVSSGGFGIPPWPMWSSVANETDGTADVWRQPGVFHGPTAPAGRNAARIRS